MATEYGLVGGNIFHGELSASQLFHARPAAGYADLRTPVRGLYQAGSGDPRRRRGHRHPGAQRGEAGAARPSPRAAAVAAGEGVAQPTSDQPRTLQAALPAPFYVGDGALGPRARAGAVRGVVLRRPASWLGASATSGGRRRTVAVVDVAGESVLVTRSPDGATARVLQRVPPPRVAGRAGRPGGPAAGAVRRSARCAAPTTRGPTTCPAGCCVPRTPRASRTSTPGTSRCTPSRCSRLGRLPVAAPHPPEAAPPLAEALGEVPARVVRYPLASLVVGRGP